MAPLDVVPAGNDGFDDDALLTRIRIDDEDAVETISRFCEFRRDDFRDADLFELLGDAVIALCGDLFTVLRHEFDDVGIAVAIEHVVPGLATSEFETLGIVLVVPDLHNVDRILVLVDSRLALQTPADRAFQNVRIQGSKDFVKLFDDGLDLVHVIRSVCLAIIIHKT